MVVKKNPTVQEPELTVEEESPTPPEQSKPIGTEKQEKKYPHRISFDMEASQYERLRYAAFRSKRSMNKILREAIEEWMRTNNY